MATNEVKLTLNNANIGEMVVKAGRQIARDTASATVAMTCARLRARGFHVSEGMESAVLAEVMAELEATLSGGGE